jgi:N-acyl homoserine lactone hydrolase
VTRVTDFEGARYEHVVGDHEPVPGIRVFASPGHSPGHQSLVVETSDGPLLLVGQAVYSHGEWAGIDGARDGSVGAPDGSAYARSVERLRALKPKRVLFGHDRRGWPD